MGSDAATTSHPTRPEADDDADDDAEAKCSELTNDVDDLDVKISKFRQRMPIHETELERLKNVIYKILYYIFFYICYFFFFFFF